MCQAMSACDCKSDLLRLCRLRVCKSGVLDCMRVLSDVSAMSARDCKSNLLRLCRLRVCKSGVLNCTRVLSDVSGYVST